VKNLSPKKRKKKACAIEHHNTPLRRKRILGNGNENGNESLSEGSAYLKMKMKMK
jgi:hypothetical protein